MIHPSNLSNDQFLATVFRHRTPTEHIFTASFPGEPSQGDFRFTPFVPPGNNNYFCLSTLSAPPTETPRTPANCAALYVMVVDDVIEKIEPQRVEGILGAPSYTIETSSGSIQWGYLLDPPARDPSVAEGIVRGLAACFTPDMAGRNRLARLPIGRNGKAGKGDFESVLHFWNPNLTLTPHEALERLESRPVPTEELIQKPFLPADRDPVLLALSDFSPTRTPGTYRITCPWVEEHTGKRDDGTVYMAPAGFKCHHGHCADRTFADFRKHLGLTAEEIDDAIVEAELTEDRMDIAAMQAAKAESPERVPIEEVKDELLNSPKLVHPWLSQTVKDLFHDDGTPLTRDELAKLYPRKWLFQNTIPMGVPWGIAGEGGLGKSRLGLALCMSVASGVPLGDDLVPAIEEGAPVVFLTQEDGRPDRAWRFITQLEYMAERDDRWRDPQTLRRLRQNLMIPQLPFGQTLSKAFREGAQKLVKELGAVRLMMFDPLILFWDHADDTTNINSASGTINTFRHMIGCAQHPDRKEFDEWSIGLLHHLSKAGEVYGSAMIQAHLRTLFGLTRGDTGGLELEVLKVNGSNILGRKYAWSMDPISGAVFPERLLGDLSPAEKVARALHSGILKWDQGPKALIKQAARLDFLGADPCATVKQVLDDWESELPEHLGLTKMPYGKYRPIEGWEINQ